MYGLYQIVYFTIIDIINTLMSPFFVIIFLVIYYQYHKIGRLESNIQGRKKSPLIKAVTSTLYGVFGGVIATVAFIYLEVVVVPKDYMYIIIVAIILSMLNPRYMCFAYGGSIVSLVSLVAGYPRIKTEEVMIVVAVLHIIESILILMEGSRNSLPIYYEVHHEIVGGYNMNRFWPLPFVIFIGDGLIQPITLMAILSYADFTVSSFPQRKTIKTSIVLLMYSVILLILAKYQENQLIPPLFALFGHEGLILFNKYMENKRIKVFTNPHKGIRVLDVNPKSLAYKIGIRRGDIILSINNTDILNERDLSDIEALKPEALTIRYFNRRKGLVTKNYRGNGKALGIVVVPRALH